MRIWGDRELHAPAAWSLNHCVNSTGCMRISQTQPLWYDNRRLPSGLLQSLPRHLMSHFSPAHEGEIT